MRSSAVRWRTRRRWPRWRTVIGWSPTAVAGLRAREADRRRDWVEQTNTGLLRGYDLVVVEDLAVKNMVRSARGSVEALGTNVARRRVVLPVGTPARRAARAKRCSGAGPADIEPTPM